MMQNKLMYYSAVAVYTALFLALAFYALWAMEGQPLHATVAAIGLIAWTSIGLQVAATKTSMLKSQSQKELERILEMK